MEITKTKDAGLHTGFKELDKITNGWQPSELVVIAGRPSMGKTAFALSMIKRMAVDNKIPCAYFSLKMCTQQLVQRLMINVCELSDNKIQNGQLASSEWIRFEDGVQQLYNSPLYIDDTPSVSNSELQTKARQMVKEFGVRMILIDYLQLVTGGKEINNRTEEQTHILQRLKELSQELKIPIIALSQLNRTTNREDNRPGLSGFREMEKSIEQYADKVCIIHRPEYYNVSTEEGKKVSEDAEIIIYDIKRRESHIIKFQLTTQTMQFEEYINEL